MGRILHICQSVEGALKFWKTKEWKHVARENGISPEEAKEIFWGYLREGKRVIPLGEPCVGFDYQTGCPGHEKEETHEKKKEI